MRWQFRGVASAASIVALVVLCRLSEVTGVLSAVNNSTSYLEACKPLKCGGIGAEVRYPFWIKELQPAEICGVPELPLRCDGAGGNLLLPLFGQEFSVKDIFYENSSILVMAQPAIYGNSCYIPGFNFGNTSRGIHSLSRRNSWFRLLNCSEEIVGHANYSRLPCGRDLGGQGVLYYSTQPYRVDLSDTGARRPINSDPENCLGDWVPTAAPVQPFPALDTMAGFQKLTKYGFLYGWNAPKCVENCYGSGGLCGYSNVTSGTICICKKSTATSPCVSERQTGQEPEPKPRGKLRSKRRIVIALIGFFILLIMFGILGICFYFRRLKMNRMDETALTYNQKLDIVLAPLALIRYKYIDVKRMTNSFAEKLGRGGFGTVYKGKLSNGISVAVKVLSDSKGSGDDFINEVASIGRTNHINVVGLLGFCFERTKRALVYEFMPNGSLEKFLFHDNSEEVCLAWDDLFKISLGIAKGLEYLHKGCKTRIVHFDIKPHNILLDEDFIPKISDFGLEKFCPHKESVISIDFARGTIGYIAPEVFSRNFGTVSSKSDVYSYGMMILEMVGRRRNVDPRAEKSSQVYFPHWVYDHLQQDEELEVCGITIETQEIAKKMIIVGLWCIQTNPNSRPMIGRVVEMLEGTFSSLPMPPRPYICSPPRSKHGDSILSSLVNTMSTSEHNVC